MDPLTQIVSLLRPHAVFSKPITGRGRWGVHYGNVGVPGFCIVLKGHCWLTFEDDPPRLLESGDFLFLPVTPSFSMVSELGIECVPGQDSREEVRHGDPEGPPEFHMIGGTFQVEPANVALLQFMSQRIHVRRANAETDRLARIIDLILDEYLTTTRPGRETVLEHLLEVMLIEALRWPGLGQDYASSGLIAGLCDANIAVALRAMHSDVRHRWTVSELARHAGMSRSAFAMRFAAKVGCAPMKYLSTWRMSLAQDALNRGGKSLEILATEIGYESASAFSTAFRKRIGSSPRRFARKRQSSSAL